MVHTFIKQEPRGFAQGFMKSFMPAYEQAGQETKQELMRQKLLGESEQRRQQLLREEQQRLESENEAFKKLGIDLTGTYDPKLRERTLQGLLVSPQTSDEAKAKLLQDQNAYKIVENSFGKEFANLWINSGPGAQTALINQALDLASRGEDINKYLRQYGMEEGPKIPSEKTTPEKEYKLDVRGYSPKEVTQYKANLRKENSPIYQEATTKVKSLEKEIFALNQLSKLSSKVPEGIFGKLTSGINPMTGELILPEAANPETELFVKTVNNFISAAKDTFGARVTNFDLQSFMNRLPKLSNSKEGRDLIIKQMNYLAKLDQLHNNSLREVYRKYGTGNITPEDAERLAEENIIDKVEKIKTKFDEDQLQQKPLLIPTDEVIAEYMQKYIDPKTGLPDEQAIRKALLEDGYEL